MNYIIQKKRDKLVLPTSRKITVDEFVSRMGSLLFDTTVTRQVLELLADGGEWRLELSKSQQLLIDPPPSSPRTFKGFK